MNLKMVGLRILTILSFALVVHQKILVTAQRLNSTIDGVRPKVFTQMLEYDPDTRLYHVRVSIGDPPQYFNVESMLDAKQQEIE